MSVREYVGARYVPLFADPAEWDNTKTYEPLTIVLYQGNSYTSRQFVPAGIEITNEEFWVETGNYNAQVEQYRQEAKQYRQEAKQYRQEVEQYKEQVNSLDDQVTTNTNNINIVDEKVGGMITPEMFGAVGDGVTDDTDAVQAALNAVNDNTVLVLRSMYGISKRLTANNPSTKIIALASTYNSPGFYALNSNIDTMLYVTRHGLFIQNVAFNMAGAKNTTTGIEFMISYYSDSSMNANTDAKIIGCSFINIDTGVKVRGRNVHFNECLFSQNRIGVYIEQADNEQLECRNTLIDSCEFHSIGEFESDGSGCGIFSDTAKNLTEYTPNNVVIKNCFANFCNNFYNGWQFVEITNCVFAHFRTKGSSNYIVKVRSKSSNLFNEGFTYTGNTYVKGSIAGTNLTYAIIMESIINGFISNNVLATDKKGTEEIIFGSNSKDVVIANNQFLNAESIVAHNMVSNSTGLSTGNIATVYNQYNYNGLTVGVNYPLS